MEDRESLVSARVATLERTNGALKLSPGTLYGSIRRMLEEGLLVELTDRQRPDEDDERRRYYRITARTAPREQVSTLCTVPAIRATRIDPMIALRGD